MMSFCGSHCSSIGCPPSTNSLATSACSHLNTGRLMEAFGRKIYKANTIECQRAVWSMALQLPQWMDDKNKALRGNLCR